MDKCRGITFQPNMNVLYLDFYVLGADAWIS